MTYKNVTLIGDAALSFHYSAGQGVTSAFTMGYTLAHCLQKHGDVGMALQHYSKSIQLMYKQPSAQSMNHIEWFEHIDSHFQNTPDNHLLDLFIQKDQYNMTEKVPETAQIL